MRRVISVLIWLLYGRVFVRVPELAGDARQLWQLSSLTEQTDAARSRFLMRYCVSKTLDVVHRYALLVSKSDML